MRILHTSDWHLGHSLHDHSREHEHTAFLDWLARSLREHAVDALVVAGDLFDSTNPSPQAQRALYEFLARVRSDLPALEVVLIGGNHDSSPRLDSVRPLLALIGRLHIVGGVPRNTDNAFDPHGLLIPLTGASGAVEAWVAAVPYLRPADLPPGDDLVAGVRAVYSDALAAARSVRAPGQALIATGHCFMVGGQLSELSERKIQVGNQQALPVDVFTDDVAYIALGHLHLGQKVGGKDHVRYSGSPIPLSMNEADYHHAALLVDLAGEQLERVTALPIPRTVDLLRFGPADKAEIVRQIKALPAKKAGDDEARYPYLEVTVTAAAIDPTLRDDIKGAVADRAARLVRVGRAGTGISELGAYSVEGRGLDDIQPEAVFRQAWARQPAAAPEPPEPILDAFRLLEQWASHVSDADADREVRRLELLKDTSAPSRDMRS